RSSTPSAAFRPLPCSRVAANWPGRQARCRRPISCAGRASTCRHNLERSQKTCNAPGYSVVPIVTALAVAVGGMACPSALHGRADVEQALAFGRAAGMTGTETCTRALLEQQAIQHCDEADC